MPPKKTAAAALRKALTRAEMKRSEID